VSTNSPLKEKIFIIIFKSDTPAGKAFDVALLWAIVLSMLAVFLESVQEIQKTYGAAIWILEIILTILFTLEYLIRLYCVEDRAKYARSFFGIIDILAILPTYMAIFLPGAQPLIVIRILRLLRVFRILKLTHFVSEADIIKKAVVASINKITVFLFAVLTVLIIVAALVYVIEGPENGFTSIPVSLYWAIVTLTTVGYGDIVPLTFFGRLIANIVMILGYGLIAVPTGIVSVEMAQASREAKIEKACDECLNNNLDCDANFCKKCGKRLKDK
jgi:voltage-gated potassium channel